MGDVEKLGTLKNAFLAPLGPLAKITSVGSLYPATIDLPGTNLGHSPAQVSTGISLHDHHNIEIKTVSEISLAPSLVETDIFLFVPKNFELAGMGKEELIKDFRSRIRLAIPVTGDQGAAALELAMKNLRAHLTRLERAEKLGEPGLDFNHELCEEVLEAAKDLSAVIGETLKHKSAEHSRQFMLSHTLMTLTQAAVAGLEQLRENTRTAAEKMELIRTTIDSKLQASGAILTFLDEYTSQLYVNYLSTIRSELARTPTPKACENELAYSQARARTESFLDELQAKEAKYRAKFGLRCGDEESELDRERRLVRLSHLKKFFQSKTFIDVTREKAAKKVSESTATVGTAVAAFVAATIERFSRTEVGDAAFSGLALLCFGVILYVLRDRMKDWAKQRFTEKALQFLPDFEQKLIAKQKKIGRVREWFRVLKAKDVPLDVLAIRRSGSTSEMEKRLPEDVFHCRKIQEVNASTLVEDGQPAPSRALLENTRVNFDRYLKFMDDPFKELADLDPSGRFLLSKSHRVYHFYICVRTTSGPVDPSLKGKIGVSQVPRSQRHTNTQLYRVVIDKNGVVRLENVAI